MLIRFAFGSLILHVLMKLLTRITRKFELCHSYVRNNLLSLKVLLRLWQRPIVRPEKHTRSTRPYSFFDGEIRRKMAGLVRLLPIVTLAQVNHQRHPQFGRTFHILYNRRTNVFDSRLFHLKHQFVVNLH